MKWHWNRTMLNLCGIVVAILKMATGRNFSMSTRYKKWAVKIQHCPISTKFDMWVDNDILNWLPTLKNFYQSPFSKWPPQYRKYSTLSDIIKIWYVGVEIFQCRQSIQDIIIYPHIKFCWYRTMLNFYRPFFIPCFGNHFENGRHLENFETQNRYMFLVGPKVFSFVVKGVKVIFWGVHRGGGYYRILRESWNFVH
jgi:hypothetical protein